MRTRRFQQTIARGLICPLFCLSALAAEALTVTTGSSNANWGTVDKDFLVVSESAKTITATPKPGYRFVQWSVSVPPGTAFSALATSTPSEPTAILRPDTTVTMASLLANFNYGIYTVTFDPQGGTCEEASRTVTNAAKADWKDFSLPTPTRADHRFLGWQLDGESVPASGKLWLEKDITLVATWEKTHYTITFDPNGGTCSETSRKVEVNQEIGALPTATLDDEHELAGWFDAKSGGASFGGTTRFTWDHDITLYAHWQAAPTYAVKTAVEPETAGACTGAGTYFAGAKVTLTATPNAGYSFARWSDAVLTPTRTVTVERGATYTAVFTGNVYRVAFNAVRAEATVEPAEATVTYGDAFGELPTPACADYRFNGWYTEVVGGTKVEPTTRVTTTGTDGLITLYAGWTKIPFYRVRFEGNGATAGEMGDQKILCGETTTLASNAFVRTGYAFRGWKDAKGTYRADGARVSNLANDEETYVLTAQWEANPYEIEFDANGQRGTMPSVAATYDRPLTLPTCAFTNLTGTFAGWTNAVVTVPIADGAEVTNLATGGVVRLFAKWDDARNDLSRAAHTVNVILETTATRPWTAEAAGAKSSVLTGSGLSKLTAKVTGPGTFSFVWKASKGPQNFVVMKNSQTYPGNIIGRETDISDLPENRPAEDGWTKATLKLTGAETETTTLEWWSYANRADDYLLIDRVVWTPAGDRVEPTAENAPTIAGFARKDGGFALSFASDDRFDYRVWATDSLAEPDWQICPEAARGAGTGGTLVFDLPVDATRASRFFRVEVMARETP